MIAGWREYTVHQVPVDENGCSRFDLWVFLPQRKRHVKILSAGDSFTNEMKQKIGRHVVAKVYVRGEMTEDPIKAEPIVISSTTKEEPKGIQEEIFKKRYNDKIGVEAEKKLNNLCTELLSATPPVPEAIEKSLVDMTDNILEVVAPDVKEIKDVMKQNVKHIDVMMDASAISTLAIVIGFLEGFNSKKAFRELAFASILMDAGMVEFGQDVVDQYYKDRTALDPSVLKKIQDHPRKAHLNAQQKLKSVTEGTLQLILNHHELFNGKGYPRGIRVESLFPIARVMALAVDLFEHIKGAKLRGEVLDLRQAIEKLMDNSVEPHLRRHSMALMQKLHKFILETEPQVEGPQSPSTT